MASYESYMIRTDTKIPGKFYSLYSDSNGTELAILKDVEDAKFEQIETNKNDIASIKAKNDFQDIQINDLTSTSNDVVQIALDNQARINNLENTEIDQILQFISRATITKPFTNASIIEIQHNRDIITNVVIMKEVENTSIKKHYISTIADWSSIEELIDGVWFKKVVITADPPITGYAVLL